MPTLLPPTLFLPGIHYAADSAGGYRPGPPAADLPLGAPEAADPTPANAQTTRGDLVIDLAVMVAAIVALKLALPASLTADAGWGLRLLVPLKMLGLVLLATWLIRRRGERWADLGLKRPAKLWHIPVFGIAAYIASFMIVATFASIILPALGLTNNMGHAPSAFATLKGDTLQYLFWLIPVSWGSAAFGEEMLYRGFIMNRMGRIFGGTTGAFLLAALAQAAVFSLGHLYLGLSGALVAGLMGFLMGLTVLAVGRNLWPAFIAHGLTDSVSMTILYLGLAGH